MTGIFLPSLRVTVGIYAFSCSDDMERANDDLSKVRDDIDAGIIDGSATWSWLPWISKHLTWQLPTTAPKHVVFHVLPRIMRLLCFSSVFFQPLNQKAPLLSCTTTLCNDSASFVSYPRYPPDVDILAYQEILSMDFWLQCLSTCRPRNDLFM